MKNLFTSFLFVFFTFFVGISIASYNTIQTRLINVEHSWSNLEVVLQRRADLIPNLLEIVKNYAIYEKETITQIIQARQQLFQYKPSLDQPSNQLKDYQQAEQQLSSSLSRLIAVAENYPDLKSNQNFLDLQHQLEGTENRIAIARQELNASIAAYNKSLKTFPNNVVNALFLKYQTKVGFQVSPYAEKPPVLNF